MPHPRLRSLATPRRADAAVAAGLLLWGLPDVPWWWRPEGHGARTAVVLGYLALALVMSVPFLTWRRAPLAVLAGCLGVLAVRAALHRNLVSADAAVLVAAYGVGAFNPSSRPARWLGSGCLAVGLLIGTVDNYHRMSGLPPALLGAAFLVGDAAAARRSEASAAVAAAHRAERTRIARELHDVLTHQLSAITVQAGAARLAATGPAEAAEALLSIEQQGREALTELNHLLGVLRRDTDDAPQRRPPPTLAGLADLVAEANGRRMPVTLTVRGRVRDVTPGLQLSAYRIVQEALTNVTRHAPGSRTEVSLGYHGDHLTLSVVNQPPPRPAEHRSAAEVTGGRGLLGMRERTDLYGGTLQAAATPGGGYRVAAVLPYDGDRPGTAERGSAGEPGSGGQVSPGGTGAPA